MSVEAFAAKAVELRHRCGHPYISPVNGRLCTGWYWNQLAEIGCVLNPSLDRNDDYPQNANLAWDFLKKNRKAINAEMKKLLMAC